jgi:hypothetical protein
MKAQVRNSNDNSKTPDIHASHAAPSTFIQSLSESSRPNVREAAMVLQKQHQVMRSSPKTLILQQKAALMAASPSASSLNELRKALPVQRRPGLGSISSIPSIPAGIAPAEATSSQKQPVQRYTETESTHIADDDRIWAARTRMGITARSYMHHNVGVDFNNANNFHRSASNSHAEILVSAIYLASRGDSEDLNIITERQPCGACEDDLRNIEDEADPELEIRVDYFIPHDAGANGEDLIDYYNTQGRNL